MSLAQRDPLTSPARLESLEARLLMSMDPSGSEQLMLELLNRMRMDPAGELLRLTSSLGVQATSSDPDINAALDFFNVNGVTLSQQWSLLTAVAPLAWNESLINVADAHNQAMIAADVQSHEAPGEPPIASGGLRIRFNDQGYSSQSTIAENVFAFSESVLHGHAGLAIDWGGDSSTGGIQSPPGHRESMMSSAFREVGIKITSENNSSTNVGPLVISQEFGGVVSPVPLPYLLGVAYNDLDGDAFYDIGEGLGGVNVNVLGVNGTAGNFDVSTMSAGGWQLAVPAGTYRITFSGGSLAQPIVRENVVVGSDNVKIDSLAPEMDVTGNGVSIVDGDASPSLADHTSFGNVQVTSATQTRTYTVHNLGGAALNLNGSPRVAITGTHASDFSVTLEPAAELESDQTTTFTIRFDPSAVGLRTATIVIASDDADESLYAFDISGSGVNPEVDVQGNATSIVDGDTTPSTQDFTDFRQVPVSSTALTSVTRTFTIRNTAASDLSLLGSPLVQISGAHAADFTVTTQPASSTIAGGGSTTFVITFNPSAAGLRTATVTVLTDDADEASYEFAIQGTGIETATSGNGLQIATTTPGTGTGVTTGQGVRVFYTGYLTTGGQFDSNVGGNAFNFTLGAGTVIQGWEQGIVGMKLGEKRTLVIPAALGYGSSAQSGIPANSTLIFEVERIAGDIAVGSPQGSTVVAIVSGDVTPSIADHTDMGFVTIGDGEADFTAQGVRIPGILDGNVSWTFRITATGAINLTGNPRVAISGTDASAFTVTTQPSSSAIVPSSGQSTATRDFVIRFDPNKIGLHTATVTIASDDPDENPYTFAIQGTGIADRIVGAVEDTDFVITHAMLNQSMKESGTSAYLIDSVEPGMTLLFGGVPVVPGVTTISSGQSLTWRGPANANRTIDAFKVKPFVGGVGVGSAEMIRIEVTPVDDNPTGTIADITLGSGGAGANQAINLASLFSDADITGTIARISTSLGNIDVHLFDTLTPITVANFLNYAQGGDYTNTIIHRVVSNFIVQGGGFRPQLPASHITTDPAIANEFGIASTRGTIAMAKVGNQINSATSEWFFNLNNDNAANLDNQNGGFTVFGEVIGSGMSVVDDIASTTVYSDGQTLTSVPLRNYSGGPVVDANWIKVLGVSTVSSLSFSILSNTNSNLVTPDLSGGTLNLVVAEGGVGSSDITIRATDITGRTFDATFTVGVVGVSVEAIDDAAAEPVGETPANPATFRITRTGPTDAELTVNYTIGGTATHGSDFITLPLTATIPAGQTFVDVSIDPLGDAENEGNETVVLTLSSSSDYTIVGPSSDSITLSDDKSLIAIAAVDDAAAETNPGQPSNTGQFQISRTGDLSQLITVHYSILGSATNGIDFELISQSIEIPAGESSVLINVTPIHDTISELAENVTISLTADANYVVDDDGAAATVIISDNDPVLVQIAVIEAAVSEDAPQTLGVVRFSRTGATTSALVVKFTRGGKATFGTTGDYTLSLGQTNLTTTSITIPAGQAFVDVSIHVIDDTKPDAGETILLTLATGTGYALPALLDRSVTLTIADNEPVVSIASQDFTGADNEAAETDAGQASDRGLFRISRTGSTDQPLVVKFTKSGTAKNPRDYLLTVGGVVITGTTVTIPAGLSHIDVLVEPVNDQVIESTETVVLKLAANTALYSLTPILANQSATVTIADNEPFVSVASIGFTGADAQAAETHTGETANTAIFRVSRTSSGPAISLSFRLGGTARRGTTADYVLMINNVVLTTSAVIIPAGASFVDVMVVPINDVTPEAGAPETVIFTLNRAITTYRMDPDAADLTATVTIADNEPVVSVVAIDPTAAEPGGAGNTGRFRISRTGSATSALDVTFKLTGTAKSGSDYVSPGTKVTIPAGASFVDVDIEPLTDALVEQPETVVMTIAAGKTYSVDAASAVATVTIADGALLAGADLVMLSAVVPAKTFKLSTTNTASKVSATIKNQGAVPIDAGAKVRVMLSKNRALGAGDIELGFMTLPAIAAGKTAVASGSFNITGLNLDSDDLGSYFLLFILDSDEVVAEVIETNNFYASPLASWIVAP